MKTKLPMEIQEFSSNGDAVDVAPVPVHEDEAAVEPCRTTSTGSS